MISNWRPFPHLKPSSLFYSVASHTPSLVNPAELRKSGQRQNDVLAYTKCLMPSLNNVCSVMKAVFDCRRLHIQLCPFLARE